MRLRRTDGSVAVGVAAGGGERLLDLGAASAARTGTSQPESDDPMLALIASGRAGIETAQRTAEWAEREGHAAWFFAPDSADWLIPVPARFCLAAGRNFPAHLQESVTANPAQYHFEFPTGFVKLPQNLVPHRTKVARPPDVIQFDYEIELTAVIGTAIERVPEERALDAVFGYTIMNDLSAREWQFREMANKLLLVGKNFPGFGPLGPYILTADEVTDPGLFHMRLSVNGEPRQDSTCENMSFSVAQIIAFWSRVGLAPGDLISTGTPEGVAHFRPDRPASYLKPGDLVSATIDRIGTLDTYIV